MEIEELMSLGDAVRNNCAFCHLERTVKDDNHQTDCAYWSFF